MRPGARLFQVTGLLAAATVLAGATSAAEQPLLVKDINPGGSSLLDQLTEMDGTLYFRADDGSTGSELWRSDGSESGTFLVSDIAPGSAPSAPADLTAVGTTLFFRRGWPPADAELWKSDGTDSGTVLVKNINPSGGSLPQELTDVNGTLFFFADDGEHGEELWRSDGTGAGTVLVKDIGPGAASGAPRRLTAVGNALFFVAGDGIHGRELWRSDGTEEGTVLVKDVWPGPDAADPVELTQLSGTLLFAAREPTTGQELWRSDGNEAGTELVEDIAPGSSSAAPASLTRFGDDIFFSAVEPVAGRELWTSDGTAVGTVLVRDIRSAGSSSPVELGAAGGRLFFAADDGVRGPALWATDGSEPGTVLVRDIRPGPGDAQIREIADTGPAAFFLADRGEGFGLWTSDGTSTGTMLVEDGCCGELTFAGGTLFLARQELWSVPLTATGRCELLGSTLEIEPPAAGSATVARAGREIVVAGMSACTGSPTVDNVDAIVVRGTAGSELVEFRLGDGGFAPGKTPEGSGSSEIEITVDLGVGGDEVLLEAGLEDDVLALGSAGADVNGDDDVDFTFAGVERLRMRGGDGDDVISGAGGGPTGRETELPLSLYGEDGDDRLVGGLAGDMLEGGSGNDQFTTLARKDGPDTYVGDTGVDLMSYASRRRSLVISLNSFGTDGEELEFDNVWNDIENVVGGKASDQIIAPRSSLNVIRGGRGNDMINVIDFRPGDVANGEGGRDTCEVDAGDSRKKCER